MDHVEGHAQDIEPEFCQRTNPFLLFFHPSNKLTVSAEASWSHYIPGGYSPSRCMTFHGRTMINFILLLAGISIMFFGYDSSCMSQVNTNPNYLKLMGTDSGSGRDSAAVGGLVTLWFGGFGVGVSFFALSKTSSQ